MVHRYGDVIWWANTPWHRLITLGCGIRLSHAVPAGTWRTFSCHGGRESRGGVRRPPDSGMARDTLGLGPDKWSTPVGFRTLEVCLALLQKGVLQEPLNLGRGSAHSGARTLNKVQLNW